MSPADRRSWTKPSAADEVATLPAPPEELAENDDEVRVLAPFVIHYQPIVDLLTHRMVGCEALARWPKPDGRLHGPGRFIEGIEADPSLAEEMTQQVLNTVCRDLGSFLAEVDDFYVGTNVPATLLGNGRLGRMMKQAGLSDLVPRIVVEVTERHAVDEAGRQALRNARAMGARVALDDFGTGRSGFQELMGMEIDIIKIDRSLVEPLNRDVTAERLVRGLATFAAILRVKMVAEGVETREQAAFLRAAGVDCGQGWLWSKALPAEALIRCYTANAPMLSPA